ncbi:hypothetical protein ILUMI_20072, partial [Ignelater luminosus]
MDLEDDEEEMVQTIHKVIFRKPAYSFIMSTLWITLIIAILVIIRNYYIFR